MIHNLIQNFSNAELKQIKDLFKFEHNAEIPYSIYEVQYPFLERVRNALSIDEQNNLILAYKIYHRINRKQNIRIRPHSTLLAAITWQLQHELKHTSDQQNVD